eukprot:4030025-Lingulodinium_polyedra.AAC.1
MANEGAAVEGQHHSEVPVGAGGLLASATPRDGPWERPVAVVDVLGVRPPVGRERTTRQRRREAEDVGPAP